MKWLARFIKPTKPVASYRLMSIEDRRREEEIKHCILCKLRKRLKDERGRKS